MSNIEHMLMFPVACLSNGQSITIVKHVYPLQSCIVVYLSFQTYLICRIYLEFPLLGTYVIILMNQVLYHLTLTFVNCYDFGLMPII